MKKKALNVLRCFYFEMKLTAFVSRSRQTVDTTHQCQSPFLHDRRTWHCHSRHPVHPEQLPWQHNPDGSGTADDVSPAEDKECVKIKVNLKFRDLPADLPLGACSTGESRAYG